MIYRNDNIEKTDTSVKGTIKDIMEYLRYEIASQCMTGADCDYNDFLYNARQILDVIETLQEDLENELKTENDVVIVKEHVMGGLYIESEEN